MFDVTPYVELVFVFIGFLITTFVIPFIRKKTTVAQQIEIDNWVAIAVAAAEQIYAGSSRGKEKKEYVMQWLNANNIKMDPSKLDVMIEAAVYQLKSGIIVQEDISVDRNE